MRFNSSLFVSLFLVFLSASIKAAEVDTPTLVPVNPFNPLEDATRLDDALEDLFTDEAEIIAVMCYRTTNQRTSIATTYNTNFGNNLAAVFKDKLAGEFQDMMVLMTYPTADYLAIELHRCLGRTGLNTNEACVTEILISRTNLEINQTKAAYERIHGVSLNSDINSATSLSERDLLISLAEARRYEGSNIDSNQVFYDAEDLYNAAEGSLVGTDDAVFIDIFSHRSYLHLFEVEDEYFVQYRSDLKTVIEIKFSGSFRDSLLAILDYTNSKAQYFARRLKSSLNGVGTDNLGLTRQVVSRAELNLETIKSEYMKIFATTLQDDITKDTSGSFRDALLALVN